MGKESSLGGQSCGPDGGWENLRVEEEGQGGIKRERGCWSEMPAQPRAIAYGIEKMVMGLFPNPQPGLCNREETPGRGRP